MVLEKRRDPLLVLGIAAVLSARYFYRAKQLRPFQVRASLAVMFDGLLVVLESTCKHNLVELCISQASVIVAWPALGVAVMETVIENSTPSTVC
jgi:hypothetical protein